MTQVRIRVPAALRDLAGGAPTVVVDIVDIVDMVDAVDPVDPVDAVDAVDAVELTVGAVLDALAGTHPALERRVRDELGRMRVHVNVFVGADNVRDRGGLAAPVPAGAELTIIPAISGG